VAAAMTRGKDAPDAAAPMPSAAPLRKSRRVIGVSTAAHLAILTIRKSLFSRNFLLKKQARPRVHCNAAWAASIRVAGFQNLLAHQCTGTLDLGIDETDPIIGLVDVTPDFEHIKAAIAFERLDGRQHFDILVDRVGLIGWDFAVKAQKLIRLSDRVGRTGVR